MEKRTSLYDHHVALGGKIVPFAGYSLPVQYSGVTQEHMAVRSGVGLFDVSHMGEIVISGSDLLKNLNYLFTNDFTNMKDGKVRYTLICNKSGGILDDVIVYRMTENRYMVVPNAANVAKDLAFIREHAFGDVTIEDISDSTAQIALQGPKSVEVLMKLTDEGSIPTGYYSFLENVVIGGVTCLISQTGYTGELGFELYCDNSDVQTLWNSLISAGEQFGILPCGLAARDTLRFEASMPLYGNEMSDDITPFEAGLSFAVKMDKEDFIGKKALAALGEPKRVRVGIKITGRGIAREHSNVIIGGKSVGTTTSGTFCPYLKAAFAMALIEKEHSAIGTVLEIEVRGRMLEGEVVPMPFYKKSY